MAGRYSRARDTSGDYWPGFVDALATLVLVITLLMTLFMMAKFFQDQFVNQLDTANQRLQEQIAELTAALNLEQRENEELSLQVTELQSSLDEAQAEAAAFVGPLPPTPVADEDGETPGLIALQEELEEERRVSAAAQNQLQLLNRQIAALNRQIQSLQAALDAAEERDRENRVTIADLGKRLNTALARKVQELARYRSEFFGRLREIMADREDIKVVGDRFVFQSEVLFGSGTAEINAEGQRQLRKLAAAMRQLVTEIPSDVNWVLRVDGHTDSRPIRTAQYPSNWHLSSARAISVVEFLRNQGVPANRLLAAGFGEYQPIDDGQTEEAFRNNRRIELKLTER